MNSFLLFLLLVVGFYVWLSKGKSKGPPKTVQELLEAGEVFPDGLVKVGNDYRIVLEVEPANMDTASLQEKKAIWMNFLNLVNTMGIPYTLLMQSQLFEMKDYTSEYGKRVANPDLTPELRESGQQVKVYLEQTTEESKIRDFRGYLILHYNPVAAAVSSGVETGVGVLDRILGQALPNKDHAKLSDHEKADLARQMLLDATEYVYGFCEQAGMRVQLLSRAGVWNMEYQLLQREVAPHARMMDAMEQQAFKPFKRSLTRQALKEEGIDGIKEVVGDRPEDIDAAAP
jgi:hypothetical protein